MSGKLKFLFVCIYVVGFGFLLHALTLGKNMGILDPKGTVAAQEKELIMLSMLLMLIVVLPVYVLTIHFTWKYRDNNPTGQKYHPTEDRNTLEEFIWWAIPTIIVIVLGSITWTSSHRLDPYKPLVSDVRPITIQVVALDWKWLFIYPEQGIATLGYVEFPDNTPINFQITADAPMNSFWIPQLAGQVYAMAGMNTQLHVMADEGGEYRGVSSNFSGAGFSEMRFNAKVVSQSEFNSFTQSTRNSPFVLSQEEYGKLALPSREEPERSYRSVDVNLYNDIIMKYMTPKATTATTSSFENTVPMMDMNEAGDKASTMIIQI